MTRSSRISTPVLVRTPRRSSIRLVSEHDARRVPLQCPHGEPPGCDEQDREQQVADGRRGLREGDHDHDRQMPPRRSTVTRGQPSTSHVGRSSTTTDLALREELPRQRHRQPSVLRASAELARNRSGESQHRSVGSRGAQYATPALSVPLRPSLPSSWANETGGSTHRYLGKRSRDRVHLVQPELDRAVGQEVDPSDSHGPRRASRRAGRPLASARAARRGSRAGSSRGALAIPSPPTYLSE